MLFKQGAAASVIPQQNECNEQSFRLGRKDRRGEKCSLEEPDDFRPLVRLLARIFLKSERQPVRNNSHRPVTASHTAAKRQGRAHRPV